MLQAGKEPFGPTSHLSRSGRERSHPQARAVAQRRSRVSGLTRPSAEAIQGFGLGVVAVTLARSAAVCSKSFFLSSLPIRKGLILILGFWFPVDFIHRFVATTTCSFTTCSLTT